MIHWLDSTALPDQQPLRAPLVACLVALEPVSAGLDRKVYLMIRL
jgi:hypothetical protein